jgi:mannose-6-phosphate isomerase-like protein (cupin superfamily)
MKDVSREGREEIMAVVGGEGRMWVRHSPLTLIAADDVL